MPRKKFLHICATDFYYPSFSELFAERLCEARAAAMSPSASSLRIPGQKRLKAQSNLCAAILKRSNFIAFEGAFHSRTLGAISLRFKLKQKYRQQAFWTVAFRRTSFTIRQIRIGKIIGKRRQPICSAFQRVAPDEIAAVFIEPILGEGGYVLPPKEFLSYWRRFCDDNETVLVF